MRVALLGTGAMGAPVARRLAQGGWPVTAWNRTIERARALEDDGVTVAETPAQAVAKADVVLLWLADADAIRASLDEAGGYPALAGRLVIQMGTIAPDESRELAGAVEAAGGRYLECPVLGSIPEARDGRLILIAGGDEVTFAAAEPLLAAISPSPTRVGAVGQGAATKLAFSHLIGALTGAFSLSLGLVRREGVDTETFMGLLRGSALYAPTFDKKLENMRQRDFASANFSTRHLLKDLRLFEMAAREAGLDPQTVPALAQAVEQTAEAGAADADYSALYDTLDPR